MNSLHLAHIGRALDCMAEIQKLSSLSMSCQAFSLHYIYVSCSFKSHYASGCLCCEFDVPTLKLTCTTLATYVKWTQLKFPNFFLPN